MYRLQQATSSLILQLQNGEERPTFHYVKTRRDARAESVIVDSCIYESRIAEELLLVDRPALIVTTADEH
jgi:hypothetical protein